jgi:DNA-3-methyladenine glycosylase
MPISTRRSVYPVSSVRRYTEGSEPLSESFFARPTVEVAKALLGTLLVHELAGGVRVGRVVETEAYVGPDDRGSHAHRGLTERTRPMFGPPGHAYVYLIYGMHNCFNVVTERTGYPGAVLLRALEPVEGLTESASGPGRLCRAMAIHRGFSGEPVTRPPLYFLAPDRGLQPIQIASGPRIGIDYAGEWAEREWRFWIAGSSAVSRVPRRQRGS